MKTAAQRTKPAIRQKIQIRQDTACLQPGFLIPALALIIVFLTYLPSLSNEFVWDDYRIQDNPALKNPGRILDLLNPAKYSDTSDEPTYRPLVALARFLDVAVWGYWAPGHRLSNIVFFLTACWLLYWVAWRLFGNIYAAGLAALLFGLHPIQTEAVALIAFRADLLAGLFMLAAMLGYWEFRRNGRLRHLLFATGCYFLAMLGKETAVILPLLFLVFEIHFRNQPDGAFQPFKPLPYLGLTAAGVVYAGLRFLIFVPAQEYLAESYPTGLPAAIGTAVRLFALYLAKFFYPVHLTVWEPFTRSVTFDGPAAIGLLMVVLFLAVLIWFYLKDKTVCLGMLWFGVALAPVLQIVIKTPQPFAERWMFVPSMGIALGLAGLAFRIHSSLQTTRRFPPYQTWMPMAVAGMILALLGCRTVFRTFDFKDDLSLWSAVVRVHPENPGTLVSLAGIHINRLDFGKALVYLEKAERLNPADPLTLANLAGSLAITHYHLENYEQAAKHGEFALASLKKYPKWFNKQYILRLTQDLNYAYLRVGRPEQAIECGRIATETDPGNKDSHFRLGVAFEANRDYPEALDEYQKYHELSRPSPQDLAIYHAATARVYQKMGRTLDATAILEAASSAFPEDLEIRSELGNLYLSTGRADQAERLLGKIVIIKDLDRLLAARAKPILPTAEIISAYTKANRLQAQGDTGGAVNILEEAISEGLRWEGIYFDLGVLYFKSKRYSDAANAWVAGLRLNPNDTDLLLNLGAYCWMTGAKEQAVKLLERAQTLQPDLRKVRDYLMRLKESIMVEVLAGENNK